MYEAVFDKLDQEGLSALHHAAEYNNLKLMDWCLRQKCDINITASHAAHEMLGATPVLTNTIVYIYILIRSSKFLVFFS